MSFYEGGSRKLGLIITPTTDMQIQRKWFLRAGALDNARSAREAPATSPSEGADSGFLLRLFVSPSSPRDAEEVAKVAAV